MTCALGPLPALLILSMTSLFAVGCVGGSGSSGGEPDEPPLPDQPTWHRDVAPLVHRSCVGCHDDSGIAPFSLASYADAAALAGPSAAAVQAGRMPPWGARETAQCDPRRPFVDDLRLSDREVALLARWADQGAPEGDPATAAPLPSIPLATLAGVDQTLASAVPFTTVGTRDQFRCFVLDPQLDEDVFVDGVHFVPGNPQVVHHALLYVDQDGDDAERRADADGGYDCFGGPGFSDAELLGAWAPGGVPTEMPAGSGTRLRVGARLILQIHYHPKGADDPQEDTTTVQLRYTDHTPEYLALTTLIGNFQGGFGDGDGLLPEPGESWPEFRIPAGASGHVERMRYTVPDQHEGRAFPGMFVHTVATHMHYVGTGMRMRLVRPEKTPACTTGALDPLRRCVETSCAGAGGNALYDCAISRCVGEVGQLSNTCGDCLLSQGTDDVDAIYEGCSMVRRPAQYGSIPRQPAEECLLETPDWNFEWQRSYRYDAPIRELPLVEAGDVLEFECTFDNSMNNPFVREALAEQGLDAPQDVELGDETLDEMCLMAVGVLYKWPAE